jgi:hypothetical protein
MEKIFVLNSLLQFALKKNTNKFSYDEFYSYIMQTQQLASSYDGILTQLMSLSDDFVQIVLQPDQIPTKIIEINRKVC